MLKLLRNIVTHPIKMLKTLRHINAWIKADKSAPKSPVINGRRLWDKKCRTVAALYIRNCEFDLFMQNIDAFYNDPIICLRDFTGTSTAEEPADDEPVALIAVKNDRSRIAHLLKHYREVGVTRFAFIDNGSDDGTVEEILRHDDTACWSTRAKFNSFRKAGWFNRLAAHYGVSRWYIVIDSDEYFTYPTASQMGVGQLARLASERGLKCVKAVMLDVYPDGPLMDETLSDGEYLERCVYFDRGDVSGYPGEYRYNAADNSVFGGMRTRLFFAETGMKLTKPTLLDFSRVYLLDPHRVYPRRDEWGSPHAAAILHYKFLPSDRKRYVQRVRDANYYNGSAEYKTITAKMEKTPEINAMCEHSVRFDKTAAWQYLPFIEDLAATGGAGASFEAAGAARNDKA